MKIISHNRLKPHIRTLTGARVLAIFLCTLFLLILLPFSAIFAQVVVSNPASPWTVPAGVTSIKVEVWGGGGGGGGAIVNAGGSSGGGGAGGGYATSTLTVVATQSYTITNTSGGGGGYLSSAGTAGSSSGGTGGTGGTITFSGTGGTVSASGGLGGIGGNGTAGGGGTTAGNGVTYTARFAGGTGAASNFSSFNIGGGGGGGAGNAGTGVTPPAASSTGPSNGGAGGTGNPNSAPYQGGAGGSFTGSSVFSGQGTAGSAPGGGGAGSGASTSGSNFAGGLGGAGQVVITYSLAACSTPTAAATALTFTSVTTTAISGSFTAASSAPTGGYLVIQSTSSSLSSNPVNGTGYSVGNALGGGTVCAVNTPATLTFTSTGALTAGTLYYFFIIPFNYTAGTCSQAYGTSFILSGQQYTQTILTNPGSPWVVPANVMSITVNAFGAGGGGGNGTTACSSQGDGGGGGGGAAVQATLTVSTGQSYTLSVPGAAAAAAAGGNATFSGNGYSIIAVGGGAGVTSSCAGTSAAGAGGSGSSATGAGISGVVTFNGGNGSAGADANSGVVGSGGGGAGSGSAGGAASGCTAGLGGATGTYPGGNGGKTASCGTGTTSSPGVAGSAPGGGGSGGECYSTAENGGTGGAGKIVITYIAVACTAPSALTYTSLASTYCVGTAITSNSPSFTGSAATSYSISPNITTNTGLAFSTVTGVISGTPATNSAATAYTVTLNNACGTTTVGLTIGTFTAPSALTYTLLTPTYCVGTAIAGNNPSFTGSAATSYSISPNIATNTGLAFSTVTGVISGTPTIATAATAYTVTVNNACGNTTVGLTVSTQSTAPSALTYTLLTPTYCTGTSIANNNPSFTGSAATSYAIAPNITTNTGLAFSTVTGVISGTPTIVSAATAYTVTVTNGCGSTTKVLTIGTLGPPTALTYTALTPTYCVGTAIASNTPSFTGSAATSYSISPNITTNTGLAFSTVTGVISGTPSTATAAIAYTVTVNNTCGNTTVGLTIGTSVAPSALTYSSPAPTYCTGVSITNNTPSFTGSAATSWAIAPNITTNTGLAFSTVTGVISGTPTIASAATAYTVTVTNGCGNTTVGLTIASVTAPSALSYTLLTPTYCVGAAITSNTPSFTGTAATSYSISPNITTNTGLAFSTSTGVISGTPTTVSAATAYTVTVNNACGNTTKVLTINTVTSVSALSYTTPVTYTTGIAITNNPPAITGTGTITYSGSIPAGLVLNGSTGIISGTPTTASTAANYSITATNGCSSTSANVNITVVQGFCEPITASGIMWGPNSFTTTTNSITCTGCTNAPCSSCGNTSISVPVTGLTCGTTYYYAAYATTSLGTTYGSVLSFMPTGAINANSVTIAQTIGANPACSGASLTFTATTATGGASPAYQWMLAGSPIAGATNSTYTTSSLTTGSLTCVLTSSEACPVSNPVTSNAIGMVINTSPTAPVIGTITQPTCAVATGTVALSGLPSSGSWVITGNPSGSLSSSGTTGTVPGLGANTYTFTVTNAGCTSPASGNAVINTQPVTPTAPVIGTITQPTCVTSTGSVALSGLPSSGAWTVAGTPSGATSGSGTTGTVTGLTANTYTFKVTNSVGCTSAASSGATVNAAPAAPTVPTVSTSYTCASGAVTLTPSALGANESYRWYDAVSGGSIASTANPFTPVITNTTNYFIVKYNSVSLCESSPRLAVVASKTGLDAYTPTRTTGITFSTIKGAGGTAVGSWRSGSTGIFGRNYFTNLSNTITPGFTFPYDGGIQTGFRVGMNGFITFNTASKSTGDILTAANAFITSCDPKTEPYCDDNTEFTSTGSDASLQAIAPFYHDQYEQDGLSSSVYYLVSGSSPNRILTVEWVDMTESVNSSCSTCDYSNLNYQVKLYETSGNIDFVYGNMYRGADASNSQNYTSGINSAGLAASPTLSELFTQQTVNTNSFSNTAKNNLGTYPASSTKITLARVVPNTPIVAPTCVKLIAPVDGVGNQCLNQIISWEKVDGEPTSYDVYFGAGSLPGTVTASVTTLYYDPGTLTASTTYYWKIVPRNASGVNAASTFTQRTFTTGSGNASPTSITCSAGNTVCIGQTFTFTEVGGSTSSGSSYYWTDGGCFASRCSEGVIGGCFGSCPIIGATTSSFTANAAGTYTISCFVRGCNDVTACFAKTITISATSVGGTTAATPATLCSGATSSISLSGNTGAIQWQSSPDNITFTNIPGATTSPYTTAALTSTTYYRAVVTSGACGSSNSTVATVTVNPNLPVSVSIAANPGSTICSGTSVTFTATPANGGGTPVYQWRKGGTNVGTNSTTYTDAGLANGDAISCVLTSNASCPTGNPATSNTVTMTVNPNLPVSVSIAANPGSTICSGTSVTFTATPANGGGTPVYQWKKGGTNIGTNSTTYTDAGLANGGAISCVLTSNASCPIGNPATSNTVTMTVNPNLPVSVSIAANPGSTICSGTSVTFTATPANGGGTPVYQWRKGGTNVGTNSTTYTDAGLANGDAISCVLTSNASCPTGNPATSNTVTMTVNPNLPVSVSIAANPGSTICSGTSVTFTAAPANGGGTPVYQWRKGGTNVGTNSTTYTDAGLANGDAISCILTSNASCPTGNPATSNTVTMTVNPNLPVSVSIAANPGSTICSGTSVTFTATPANGGGTPVYQWKKGGTNVGTNSTTYTDAGLANGDAISCVLTSNASCPTGNPATSNTVTMTVDAIVTTAVNLDNCSCNNIGGIRGNIVTVYARGGLGNFTFSPQTPGDALKTVIDGSGINYSGSGTGVKGVFWSKADGNLHYYTVGDGLCNVTVTTYTSNGAPTDIVFAAATQSPAGLPGQGGGNNISASYNNTGAGSPGISSAKVNGPALICHQTADFSNTWVTYIATNMNAGTGLVNSNDSTNNKAVVEINNYGQNLDSVAVSVYREPLLPSVPNVTGAAGACYQYPEYALERHFVIQSSKSTGANSFSSDIGVRLYFSDAEFQDLVYWTHHNATANANGVNASCAAAQVVNNTGQIYVTKYTGLHEDGDYSNNSVSGLYRMFGSNTTSTGNGPSTFDGNGGVFGSSLGANRHFVEFNVREFSEFWLHGSGDIEPLPVEMIYFEAEAINNEYIALGWATDIEINNKEFQVERSVDGQDWTQIGIVEGHGNSTGKLTYTYDDMKVVAGQRYYYRLKQVDFNLDYKFTGVVSAIITGSGAFSVNISPNPTYGKANLIINTVRGQEISVEVFDAIGQKMVTGSNQLTAGYNRIELDLGRLASGAYTITITSANHVYTKKLVIAK